MYICTYMHHTAQDGRRGDTSIEDALNKIVNTRDQRENMRKELKKNIYETVSTLRNLVIKMKVMLEEGTRQKSRIKKEINAINTLPSGGTFN